MTLGTGEEAGKPLLATLRGKRRAVPPAIGVDETADPAWGNAARPAGMPVQGNLDPLALIAVGQVMAGAAARILAAFADRPHIFNLCHGILPDSPIAHVERLLDMVRRR